MKSITLFITVFALLGGSASAKIAKIPEPKPGTVISGVTSRDGQSPYIQYIRGSFGGPWWNDGWLWAHPGQAFRIYWKAGDVRWCNKWSLDPQFKGPARAKGEYWTRLYRPSSNSSHGGWVFGLTCGNGVTPNVVTRIWVKVLTQMPRRIHSRG